MEQGPVAFTIRLTHILLAAILACLIYALINGWG